MSHLNDVLKYANLHVYIFPCHFITESGACSCGHPCKSPGKHPIRELVNNGHLDASNDPEQIKKWWTAAPLANPGLSLAPSSLVVIDIDPRNGGEQTFDDLEAKHGKITSEVEQLTGGGGRHIVYVADKDARYPGKLGAGVDVKHQGYIMVWPSNHVLGHYEWESESDLMEGYIPSPAPAWLALPKGDEFNVNIQPAAPGMGLSALLDTEVQEFKDALACIPNQERDDWLKVGMAIHSLDSGQAGFALWEDWSSTCDKFDAQDQARVWFSFHNKANQVNKESIFHWAQEQGWVNPMKKVVSEDVQQKANQLVNRVMAPQWIPEAVTADARVERLPFPCDELNELESLIGASGYVNHPEATRAAVLSLIAVASSRRYIGDNHEGTHIYTAIASTSVGTTRYAITAVQSLLNDTGLRHYFNSARKTTINGLYDILLKKPAHLYCIEDFGKMIQQSKKQWGNGSMEHTLDAMGSIYTKPLLQIDTDEDGKNKTLVESPFVYAPALSLIGTLSNDQITNLMKASEIGAGLVPHLFTLFCDDRESITQFNPQHLTAPHWLRHHLAALRGFNESDLRTDNLYDTSQERGDTPPPQVIVIKTLSTQDYDKKIMALSDNRLLLPVLHGARITLRRLANAIAAFVNPIAPEVTPAILEFSASEVLTHTQKFVDLFSVMESGDGDRASLSQKVLQVIAQEGGSQGLTMQELKDKCYRFKQADKEAREKVMDLLEDDGDIQFVKIGRKKCWVASRFIKNAGNSAETRETRENSGATTPEVNPTADVALMPNSGVREPYPNKKKNTI